jgi:hypothetical protein
MRAIIIEDKDARALLEQLKLELLKPHIVEDIHSNCIGGLQSPESVRNGIERAAKELHRKFHYIVCSWLQDQGCDVVRRG